MENKNNNKLVNFFFLSILDLLSRSLALLNLMHVYVFGECAYVYVIIFVRIILREVQTLIIFG